MTTEELREQIYMLMPCGAKTDIKILKRKVKKEVFFKSYYGFEEFTLLFLESF